MKNINIFGGPGTGKSTTAAGLFFLMKTNNMKVEYVQEYAKDLTFGKDYVRLSDQLLLLGEQHHRMFRLKDEVDYIVHDSPFVIGMVYADDKLIPLKEYEQLVIALYKRYDHLNIFLERSDEHPYQTYGRSQDEEQAKEKDRQIMKWLDDNGIHYHRIKMGSNSPQEILNLIG